MSWFSITKSPDRIFTQCPSNRFQSLSSLLVPEHHLRKRGSCRNHGVNVGFGSAIEYQQFRFRRTQEVFDEVSGLGRYRKLDHGGLVETPCVNLVRLGNLDEIRIIA